MSEPLLGQVNFTPGCSLVDLQISHQAIDDVYVGENSQGNDEKNDDNFFGNTHFHLKKFILILYHIYY